MVDITKLRPGDMVKIVDEWCAGCSENPQGNMDCWLGQTMTVRAISSVYVKMEEDKKEHGNGWCWYPEAIECVVDSDRNYDFFLRRQKSETDLVKYLTRQ